MAKTNESTDIYERYKIPNIIVDNENIIDLDNPTNDEEIMNLINTAYELADTKSPTGTRSPFDVKILEKKEKRIRKNAEYNGRRRKTKQNES